MVHVVELILPWKGVELILPRKGKLDGFRCRKMEANENKDAEKTT